MAEALRIGTRGSRLALWQARHTRGLLVRAHPGLAVEIVEIRTSGDRIRDRPLAETGGIGVFTKEIEEALLAGEVDVAVHSLKDLPTSIAPGLALGAVPTREDVRDAVVGKPLEAGVTVGTGSPRRRGQLLAAFPGLSVEGIRGNVPTRVAMAQDEGGPDAVILAIAGLKRLG
ncbi:MAG: hydroxymethylbilane synthase, partial [Planctomycetota bacterium]